MIKVSFILNQYYEVLQQRIEALREIDRLKQELARQDIIIRRLQTQSYGCKSERCKNVTHGEWNLLGLPLDPQSYGCKSERCKNVTQGEWNLLGLPLDPEDDNELVQLPEDSVVPPSEIVHALEEEANERRKAAREKTKREPKERAWAKVPKNLEHRREEVYPEGYPEG